MGADVNGAGSHWLVNDRGFDKDKTRAASSAATESVWNRNWKEKVAGNEEAVEAGLTGVVSAFPDAAHAFSTVHNYCCGNGGAELDFTWELDGLAASELHLLREARFEHWEVVESHKITAAQCGCAEKRCELHYRNDGECHVVDEQVLDLLSLLG